MKRLQRPEDGISLLEFAISLPFVLVLIAGVIQFGYLLAANVVIRQATVTAAREALLGLPQRSDDEIRQVAEGAIAPMLSSARLRTVTVNRNVMVGGIGGATEIILEYDLAPFIPGTFNGHGPNGEFVIRGHQIVR